MKEGVNLLKAHEIGGINYSNYDLLCAIFELMNKSESLMLEGSK